MSTYFGYIGSPFASSLKCSQKPLFWIKELGFAKYLNFYGELEGVKASEIRFSGKKCSHSLKMIKFAHDEEKMWLFPSFVCSPCCAATAWIGFRGNALVHVPFSPRIPGCALNFHLCCFLMDYPVCLVKNLYVMRCRFAGDGMLTILMREHRQRNTLNKTPNQKKTIPQKAELSAKLQD